MNAQLTVLAGSLAGKTFVVEEGRRAVLGRGDQADLVLAADGVSRRHCLLALEGGHLLVTDLHSHNGTWVNARRVASYALGPGDRLTIGDATLEVSFVEEPGQEADPRTTLCLVFEEDDVPAVTRAVPDVLDGQPRAATAAGSGADLAPGWTPATLRDLCRIGQILSAEHDPAALFETIADCVLRVLDPERVAILLRDPASGSIQPVLVRGSPGAAPGRIEVSRTVVREVLTRGVAAMSADALSDARFKLGASVMAQQIRSVACVPLRSRTAVLGALYADTTDPERRFGEADLDLLAVVGAQAGVAVERARLIERVEALFLGAVRALVASIEVRDPYTRGHSERVTAYSLALAQTLGLPDEEREVVELAALLHDVGKIGVPETILNKPGALDEAEFRILRAHPVHGEEIVRHVRHEHVARIAHAVRHHHERWDGRGYPDALPGEQLALSARILGVADAWDAMTSDRPYRRALDRGKALAILTENAGTQFDPAVVAAFGTAFTAGAIDQAARLEGPATSGRFLLKRAAPVVRPTP